MPIANADVPGHILCRSRCLTSPQFCFTGNIRFCQPDAASPFLLTVVAGLRVSELLTLRWSGVDFENVELRVTRLIWHKVVGNCKPEASAKPVLMDSYLAEDLLRWRCQSVYGSDDHYVFASETMRGKQLSWPDNLMKRHIEPAFTRASVGTPSAIPSARC